MLIQRIDSSQLAIKVVPMEHQGLRDQIEGSGTRYTIQCRHDAEAVFRFHRGFVGTNALANAIEVANQTPERITIVLTDNPEICATLTQSPPSDTDKALVPDEDMINGDRAFGNFLNLANAFAKTIESVNPKQGDEFLLELGKILITLDGRGNKSCVLRTQDCLTLIKDILKGGNTDITAPKNFLRNPSGLRDVLIELAITYLGSGDARMIVKSTNE
jgi:hypothetical protein